MDVRLNLVFGPGLLWISFVLLMIALAMDEFVTVEYTRVDNTTFTNHYGVFTAQVDGLTGLAVNRKRTVVVDCAYGIGGSYANDETTEGCEINCKTMKAMAVLSAYFTLMAVMYVYDAAEMAVVTDSKHRFIGGVQALLGTIFAATLMGTFQSQMTTAWGLPAGAASVVAGDYGTCAYKLDTADALTIRDAKTPQLGTSLIIGWTAVAIMGAGVLSHLMQVARHRVDGGSIL